MGPQAKSEELLVLRHACQQLRKLAWKVGCLNDFSPVAMQLKLMSSWAVVCDVYFLEPQAKRPEETSQQFAERVQHMIATRAKLKVAPWDGYLKYYNLASRVCAGLFMPDQCWNDSVCPSLFDWHCSKES